MIVPEGVTIYANGKRYKSGKDMPEHAMPKDFDQEKIKAMYCKKTVSIEPLRLFITGRAGVSNSHSMKIICMFHMNLDESLLRIAR